MDEATEKYVKEILADAPPLSEEQIRVLRPIWRDAIKSWMEKKSQHAPEESNPG